MEITRKSILTGTLRTIDLPITGEQYVRWQSGATIQEAMPQLTPEQREFILTGVTSDEWDIELGEESDVGY